MITLIGREMVGVKRGKLTVVSVNVQSEKDETYSLNCTCSKCGKTFEKEKEIFIKEKFNPKCIYCDTDKTKKEIEHDLSNVVFLPVDPGYSKVCYSNRPPASDFTGMHFGGITVFGYTSKSLGRNRVWNCYCDYCKRYIEMTGRELRRKRAHCGCLGSKIEESVRNNYSSPSEYSERMIRFQERVRMNQIGTKYKGFLLIQDTHKRKSAEVIWEVQAPNGEILNLTRRQMRELEERYSE